MGDDYELISKRISKKLNFKNISNFQDFKAELIRASRKGNNGNLTNFFSKGGTTKLWETETTQKAVSSQTVGAQSQVSQIRIHSKKDWSRKKRREFITEVKE